MKKILNFIISIILLTVVPAFAMWTEGRLDATELSSEGGINLKTPFVSDERFENQKVIISNLNPFLEGIRRSEDFFYSGAFKLQNKTLNLYPQVAEAIQYTAQRTELKGKPVLILEDNLTLEEQKLESDVKLGDTSEIYKKLGIRLVPGASAFNATHFKILISGKYAFVGTTNFDKEFEKNDELTRDFSLIVRDPLLIKELKDVVESDIDLAKSKLKDINFNITDIRIGGTRLSWGPNQHRQHLQQLIQTATHSIEIYQQALQDEGLTNHLVAAIKRGVKVSILMSQFPFGIKHGNKSETEQNKIVSISPAKEGGKGEVRLTGQSISVGPLKGKKLHIHAKVMIIDGDDPEKAFMYLGSANFYTPALDKDRNVGVITRDSDYITPVRTQFLQDWEAHKP